jgi:hypothetical protein
VAALVCVPAVAAYNWWLFVPFDHGLLKSANSFFSDLEVSGSRDATIFERLDVTAGVLFAIALLLNRPHRGEHRPEWPLFLAFACAVAAGGLFPFSCAEGTNSACRSAEWHLQLPWHHYAHVGTSAVEFLTISIGVLVAWRRMRGERSFEAALFRGVGIVLLVAYAPLAVAYSSDHLAALIEPVFFIAFSVAAVAEATLRPLHARREVRRSVGRPRSRTIRGSPARGAASPSSSPG